MIITRNEVKADVAQKLTLAAIQYARIKKWEIAVAVCDPRGGLVSFLRTDEVVLPAIDFAIDKAYTAASLKKSTKNFFTRANNNKSLSMGLANRPRLMVWSGGLPFFYEDNCIGGIGVSGAQDFEDIECAKEAIISLGLSFEVD
ncbi:heme-binding protein [Amylibacter sp.]|mgnify:CR=1 FL=1|nr:heme-binding protein [Amylibacter sp.]|tara:strand:- start:26 stop:457 length:432 start_codon:yes stop_codon:yes gene_type:complete